METLNPEKSAYELERNKPMPSKQHARIQSRLIFLITSNYEELYEVFSELTLRFKENNVIPDLSIYKVGVLNDWEEEIQVSVPPFCAIEILSPTQNFQELIDKAKIYFENGVQSYWLVIPALKNIHVFTSPQKYEIYKDDSVLEDKTLHIQVDLSKVF
jgi:Uma2 family endonuclease